MDRLDAMRLFVSAVSEGSLAGAARRHGRSAASVTRAIALLEDQAGEALLLRSTRRLRLTPAGEQRLDVWRDVLDRLAAIERGDDGSERTAGALSLTAPELFGRLKVLPHLESLLKVQPDVSARFLLVNRVVDLMAEGVDLAVRIGVPSDSTLTAVRLGAVRTLVCVAPALLEREGAPSTPQDLARRTCIGLNADSDAELWPFQFSSDRGARLRAVRVHTRLSLNNAAAALDAAVRGQGLIRTRAYQVAEHLAARRLVTVLADFEPPPDPVSLVFHPERARRGPVRALIDHLGPALRAELHGVEDLIASAAPSRSPSAPGIG